MRPLFYIVAVIAGLTLIGIALFFELKTTKNEQEKRIKRLDRAMEKVKDDPNEIARWIP